MPDLHQDIQDDRGLIERVAQRIPGFRGYSERESRREADRLLRGFCSAKLDHVIADLNEATKHAPLAEKHAWQECVNQAEKLRHEVQFADRGYSGFFAEIKWDRPERLAAVYEHDALIAAQLAALAERVAGGDVTTDGLRDELRRLQRGVAGRRHAILDLGGE